MSLATRLKSAMQLRGMSQLELAKQASTARVMVSQQVVQNLTSGRNKTSKHIPAIARALHIRIEWLVNGEEPIERETEGGSVSVEERKQGEADLNMADIYEIDASASAGDGANVDSAETIRTCKVPRNIVSIASDSPLDRIKIIRVKGDSMTPTFNPLDRIMVDTGDLLPSPGGIFVVWDGLGLVVKRVQLVPHSDPLRVKITSDNPRFDPYERMLGEAYIQGRVIGKWLWT